MGKIGRFVKYGFVAPVIDIAINWFPAFSTKESPPDFINFAGDGDFVALGDAIVKNLIELVGLTEGQAVVDIGCAIGRNATALFRRFGEQIDYLGFDIVRYGITWCRNHFRGAARYKFVHSDIYNSFYNPRGKLSPAEYVFPCQSGSTDVVFATSVFTHMQARETRHYINETARISKLGGRCYFTFFLLDEHSSSSIKAGTATYSFAHAGQGCRIESIAEPDMAVAYDLTWVEETLTSAGFKLERVERASWRGLESPHYQDIVVAKKIT